MKLKLLLTTLTATMALHAQTGTEIYEAKCAICHKIKPMMDKQKIMNMSPEERMSAKERMMQTMKAPPMSKVSAKIKFDLKDDKTAFVAFVKDYIVNPSSEKSHCMPMAVKRFGTMPAIGKSMKTKEIDTVANWLYDNFTQKWDANAEGMACKAKAKDKSSKCGQGKCGNADKMKKMAPKSMKCGQGKCGGN